MRILDFRDINELDLKSGDDEHEVFIIKAFMSPELCQTSVGHCHQLMRNLPHREDKDGCYYSFDVLPEKSATSRIFRTLNFLDMESPHLSPPLKDLFRQMMELQSRSIVDESVWRDGARKRRMQVIHYPRGGGFLDWHVHPRYPVNYGLILNMSEQGESFSSGGTEIVQSSGETVRVEDHSNIGDLILFRFDLKHRVAPCDPDQDLHFDANGRWTAVLPID